MGQAHAHDKLRQTLQREDVDHPVPQALLVRGRQERGYGEDRNHGQRDHRDPGLRRAQRQKEQREDGVEEDLG